MNFLSIKFFIIKFTVISEIMINIDYLMFSNHIGVYINVIHYKLYFYKIMIIHYMDFILFEILNLILTYQSNMCSISLLLKH